MYISLCLLRVLWRPFCSQRHGRGIHEFANGDKYVGTYAHDMIDGDGEMRYKLGGKYIGSWKHGRYEGQGIRKYADGTAYNGNWEAGLRHGNGEVIYPDASMYKGEWQYNQVRRWWTVCVCVCVCVYVWCNACLGGSTHTCVMMSLFCVLCVPSLTSAHASLPKPHGHGVFTRQRDPHYEGEWVNGMRQGKGSESSYEGVCVYISVWCVVCMCLCGYCGWGCLLLCSVFASGCHIPSTL